MLSVKIHIVVYTVAFQNISYFIFDNLNEIES
jgi:hypothetical protein